MCIRRRNPNESEGKPFSSLGKDRGKEGGRATTVVKINATPLLDLQTFPTYRKKLLDAALESRSWLSLPLLFAVSPIKKFVS